MTDGKSIGKELTKKLSSGKKTLKQFKKGQLVRFLENVLQDNYKDVIVSVGDLGVYLGTTKQRDDHLWVRHRIYVQSTGTKEYFYANEFEFVV